MLAIKKSIYISKSLLKETSAINSNFSAVVEEALIEYIHQYKVKKALKSFGSWTNRTESSVEIVNNLRRDDDRDLTVLNNKKNHNKENK